MSDDLLIKPKAKKPIVNMRVVMFGKMMVHPQTKEMMMIPMQDFQYQREGSDEWFSMPGIEVDKHEPNPEDKSFLQGDNKIV